MRQIRARGRARRSAAAGAAEAACAARRRSEVLDDLELCLHDGHDQELRDAIAGIDRERRSAPIPAGHHQRALIVRIDQADEVAEHDAVLVAESGARQQQRRVSRILDVQGDARRNQLGAAGAEHERSVDARAQIHGGGSGGRVPRQRKFGSDPRIEYPQLDPARDGGHRRARRLRERLRGEAAAARRLRALCRAAPGAGGIRFAISAMSSRATSIFGARAMAALPPGQMTVSALSSQSNAMPSPTWFAAIMSSFLRFILLRAFSSTSLVSAAKPTTNGRFAMSATDLTISGAGWRSSCTASPCFLIFCFATA